MSPQLTLNLTLHLGAAAGVRSGDDTAAVLHKVADDIANRWDGLTLPPDDGVILGADGEIAGEWVIA
ncbi:MAG: hypothetical protein K0S37_790 [Microbacterium sp.]|jgi:hypothetical protein|nr:hypothetical protein [Microbacterium sp.]